MVTGLLVVALAAAPLQLDWSAPPPCHTAAQARDEIARLLGRAPDATGEPAVVARAQLAPSADGRWSLTLSLQGPLGPGERALEADSCEELSAAAELIIALAIDPDAVSRATAAPPAPVPAVQPSWYGRLGLGVGADLADLPHVAPGVLLAGSFGAGRWLGRVTVSFWPPQRAPGQREGTGVAVWLLDGGLRAGLRLLEAPVELVLELGGNLGVMRGDGFGLDVTLGGSAPWAAVCAGFSAALPLTRRFSLRATAEGGLTLLRPGFVIEPQGVVFQTARGYGRLGLLAEVSF